jgi:hypothetical protein
MGYQAGLLAKRGIPDTSSVLTLTESSPANQGDETINAFSSTPIQKQNTVSEIRLLLVSFGVGPRPVEITPQPRLRSIWLVVYHPSTPRLFWIVIYPNGVQANLPNMQTLAQQFQVGPNLEPGKDFLAALQDQYQLSWNGILMLDESMLVQLVDSLGGVTKNGQNLDGTQIIQMMVVPWEDPQAAYKDQAELINALCQRRDQLAANGVDLNPVANLLLPRLNLFTNSQAYLAQLSSLLTQTGSIHCQFTGLE